MAGSQPGHGEIGWLNAGLDARLVNRANNESFGRADGIALGGRVMLGSSLRTNAQRWTRPEVRGPGR